LGTKLGCRNKECTQNFGGGTSWKTTTWNNIKMDLMEIDCGWN